jgi:hypothetical protein
MASSRATGGPSSSESGGMKTFFTTGIGPCTSYKPILWLNVISPKREPGIRAVARRNPNDDKGKLDKSTAQHCLRTKN